MKTEELKSWPSWHTDAAKNREQFLQTIEPWIKIKLLAVERSIPSFIVFSDGKIETKWSVEIQKVLDECDKQINCTLGEFTIPPETWKE